MRSYFLLGVRRKGCANKRSPAFVPTEHIVPRIRNVAPKDEDANRHKCAENNLQHSYSPDGTLDRRLLSHKAYLEAFEELFAADVDCAMLVKIYDIDAAERKAIWSG